MKRRIPVKAYWGVFALASLVVLGIIEIKRNSIYRTFFHENPYVESVQLESIRLDLEEEKRLAESSGRLRIWRPLKVSFPLEFSEQGCEFVYGLAIAKVDKPRGETKNQTRRLKYIFKFQYDLKNRRCESKDLFFDLSMQRHDLELQFVRMRLTEKMLYEEVIPRRVQVQFESTGFLKYNFSATSLPFNAKEAFFQERTTIRNKLFSSDFDPNEVEVFIQPQNSLREFIFKEMGSRIKACREKSECEEIIISSSIIWDTEIAKLIQNAREAGIPVELMVNFARYESEASKNLEIAGAWQWLRLNPYENPQILPMHIKLIIFGDDLVVSSDANLNFSAFPDSRETWTVYRSSKYNQMFREIYSLVKTGLYYPLKVDLSDEVQILLNADRPRGYSASSRKPYLAIFTENGVSTSAYGIAFKVIEEFQGPISLMMSPISDSCFAFEMMRCFFDVLTEKQENAWLSGILNLQFFMSSADQKFLRKLNLWWSEDFKKRDLEWNKIYQEINESFPSLEFQIVMDGMFSLHHQRYIRLGEEALITGSANFANPQSTNTIEIIKSSSVAKRIKNEEALFEEPYIVADYGFAKEPIRQEYSHRLFGNCAFILEFNTKRVSLKWEEKTFSKADLNRALTSKGIEPAEAMLHQPVVRDKQLDDFKDFYPVEVQSLPVNRLSSIFESPSSYLCVGDKTKTTVIRLQAAEES